MNVIRRLKFSNLIFAKLFNSSNSTDTFSLRRTQASTRSRNRYKEQKGSCFQYTGMVQQRLINFFGAIFSPPLMINSLFCQTQIHSHQYLSTLNHQCVASHFLKLFCGFLQVVLKYPCITLSPLTNISPVSPAGSV